jgi:guanylate kinase
MLNDKEELLLELKKRTTRPRIFVLVSPSGVGKTTLCQLAVRRLPSLWYSVSVTTRPKRPNEKDGTSYYFISEEEFLARRARGEFIETTKIYDAYYGTPKKPLVEALNAQRDVIMDLDIRGSINLKKFYPYTVIIYVLPPSIKVLEERFRHRKPGQGESVEVRINSVKNELLWLKQEISRKGSRIDYLLINDRLSNALKTLISIIEAEKVKVTV